MDEKVRWPSIGFIRSGRIAYQQHVTTLCGFLLSSGCDVHYYGLQCSKGELDMLARELPGLVVTHVCDRTGRALSRFVRGGMALRRALATSTASVFYVIDSWTLPYVFVATLGRMRWPRTPWVYHTFDMITPEDSGAAYRALERYAARSAQLYINTDQARSRVAKAYYSLKQEPLAVPLRLPLEAPLPSRDPGFLVERVPSFEEANGSRVLVVYPTALRADRLSLEVIEAFALLPSQYHLVTIDAAGAYAEACRDVIRDRRIDGRVHLLAPMEHAEIVRLCANADVGLIFHDVWASLGNYLAHPGRLSYLIALGVPVVASSVPNLESVIYRYGLGVCCSPYEPPAIAASIREICEGEVSLGERRKRIRGAFRSALHYEAGAAELARALRRLTDKSVEPVSV